MSESVKKIDAAFNDLRSGRPGVSECRRMRREQNYD